MLHEDDVIKTVEKALEAKSGSITLNSSVENTESWDSLGQLSILAALDKMFDGKIAEINEMAAASSVGSIVKLLKENNLI